MNTPNNNRNNSNNSPAPKKNGPPGSGNRNNRRRYRGHFNKNRSSESGPKLGVNIDRLVEKYINLLDQHIIARRKFHDLFYRAEEPQKAKLERNFYQSLNDVRDFEARIPDESKALFEKRINGLRPDTTYSENHQIDLTSAPIAIDPSEINDPHLLQTQIQTDFSHDTEESVGTSDDYQKYKML
jgi:hypothetical protein